MAWPALGMVLRAMMGRGASSGMSRAAVRHEMRMAGSMKGIAQGLMQLADVTKGGVQIGMQVVDHDGFGRALERLIERGTDLQPILAEVGSYIQSEFEDHFEREAGPDGSPWVGHSPVTLLTRGGSAKKLRHRGHLYASLAYSASQSQVAVGTNSVYARIHQFGGKAGRNRKVDIPARPFIGLNSENRQEIGRIFNQHLSVGLK